MKSTILYFSSLLILLLNSCCDAEFNVGTSCVSIEPTGETPSLALAGFASPWEGRFSLRWNYVGDAKLRSIVSYKDSLIILDDLGNVFVERNDSDIVKGGVVELKNRIGYSPSLKKIIYYDDFLYGISAGGKLMKTKFTNPLKEWLDVSVDFEIQNLVVSNDCMYLFDKSNSIYEKRESLIKKIDYKKINGEILDVVSDTNYMYVLLKNNKIYRAPLDLHTGDWSEIWYKNNDNDVVDLQGLFYINSILYAKSTDDRLYKSFHGSVGDLEINAWSIGNKKEKIVIVAADLCGLNKSFVDDIKREIKQRRGIEENAILINVSHTHFAPVTQSWLTWQKPNQLPDSAYLTKVVRNRMIQAIEESLENMVPSELYFGRDTCNIGINRSLTGADAVYDKTVDVLIAKSKRDGKKNVLFLTGCHPVFTDVDVDVYTLNANYPGYARTILRQNKEINNTIFLQAFAGDINPKDTYKITGEKLANSVKKVLFNTTLLPIKGDISYYWDSIMPPVEKLVSEDQIIQFKRENEKKKDIIAERNVNWANVQLKSIENTGKLPEMVVYYQTINIGNWKLVALSREVTSEYGIAIRNIWPKDVVSAIAYSNDVPSYLGTSPHVNCRDYEGYDSFFWYGQPFYFSNDAFSYIINEIKTNKH